MTPPDHSARYARLAADLARDPGTTPTAKQIVEQALEHFPDADQVSLTVRRKQKHETLATTGPMAGTADELQYAYGQGPCVEAAAGEGWVRSGDVRHDSRWPRWGPRAGVLGVRSMMSVQLLDGLGPVGAINSYSRKVGAFDDVDDVDRAAVFAVHAANALATATAVTNLHTALSSRHDIGMAQGILMERYGLDADRSFELLRRISADRHEKLRDVAAHVSRTRLLPGEAERRAAADVRAEDSAYAPHQDDLAAEAEGTDEADDSAQSA